MSSLKWFPVTWFYCDDCYRIWCPSWSNPRAASQRYRYESYCWTCAYFTYLLNHTHHHHTVSTDWTQLFSQGYGGQAGGYGGQAAKGNGNQCDKALTTAGVCMSSQSLSSLQRRKRKKKVIFLSQIFVGNGAAPAGHNGAAMKGYGTVFNRIKCCFTKELFLKHFIHSLIDFESVFFFSLAGYD